MKHVHYSDVKAEEVGQGAKGAKIRWLITEEDGARTFIMRHFEIAPGGSTPQHAHTWEHELFILGGSGVVVTDAGEEPLRPGDTVFVPGGEKHQFRNAGEDMMTMLCLIPARK